MHACWDEEHIQHLQDTLDNGRLSDEILLNHYKKGSRLYEAIEVTLKGKELRMPQGLTFTDKDGHERCELRIKWWLSPENMTYRQYSVEDLDSLSEELIPQALQGKSRPYPEADKPVFFGHYWLPGNAATSVYGKNVCCVDYSVAKQGKLVAYRWDGELCLDHANMYHAIPVRA